MKSGPVTRVRVYHIEMQTVKKTFPQAACTDIFQSPKARRSSVRSNRRGSGKQRAAHTKIKSGRVVKTDLTRLDRPAMMFAMADRRLRIVRFIGSTPNTAYCDVCKLAFRTRQEFITDADKAKAQLQSDFEKHECQPEEGAIDDALDHIR